MPRARVFVLREKQSQVLSSLKDLHSRFLQLEFENDADDYDPLAVQELAQELSSMFGIELKSNCIKEHVGSDLEIAGLIARKLLDKNPPDTIPPWTSPWNE
jgi:hypothetical protein